MRALVAHLKSAIETAGKRAYEFIVGKINVPKLANFPEIDAFVLVGCPETTIIDSKDHLRPIVTPYEALLALGPEENEWTGNYVLDADELLGLPVAQIDANETETPGVADGTVVASSAAVARVFDGASNHLLSRTFQGLEIMERGAPSRIQQGQRGIASSYVY